MTRLSITKTTIFMIICKSDIYKDVLTCYILIYKNILDYKSH